MQQNRETETGYDWSGRKAEGLAKIHKESHSSSAATLP